MAGWSESIAGGDKTQSTHGFGDYWIVRIDSNGAKEWDADYGNWQVEKLHAVPQTSDGGFLLAGYTFSPMGGDVSQPTQGSNDYWILKLAPECLSLAANFGYTNSGSSFQFTDSSFFATNWFWDFGDGATGTQQNPSHVYAASGIYEVCLIASNNCKSDTICHLLDIATTAEQLLSVKQSSLTISPNPFSENAQLTVVLQQPSPVTIEITKCKRHAVATCL
jgi:PKD repeat protein